MAGAATAQPRDAWKGQPDYVGALALSPDGKTLASFTRDGTITIWDMTTKKAVSSFRTKLGGGYFAAFRADGKSFVVVGENTARESDSGKPLSTPLCSAKVLDLAMDKEQLNIDFPEGGSTSVVMTADGKSLLVGGPGAGVVPYDLSTGKPSEAFPIDKESWDIKAMALSPDGTALAVCTRRGAVLLYDMEKKAARWIAAPEKTQFARSVAFSPDSKTVAAGGAGPLATLWDVASGKSTGSMDFHPRITHLRTVAFSPDGKTLVAGGDRFGVSLWDLAAGGERDDFLGDLATNQVTCFVFTPDGKTLISGGWDKAIRLWDVPQGPPPGVKPVGKWTSKEEKLTGM
jgi:WD40 repeat protein